MANETIAVQDFEDRIDVLARLIGTKKDLDEFKVWVNKQPLEEFDISPYFNKDIINKIEKFKVGYMWYSINILYCINSKLDYNLYVDLWYALDMYLTSRIDSYIFFKYYNWDVPNINLLEVSNLFNINKLKAIYEYDYKVFKVLLFLYWDLEYYLEDIDYVKESLVVNVKNSWIININISE